MSTMASDAANNSLITNGTWSLTSSNHSTNSTSESSCDFEVWYRVVICFLLGTTMLVALISNILVSLTIICTRNLRTLTNSLLVSLSIGDIIISLVLPTCEIIYVAYYPFWPIGRAGTYLLNGVWMFSLASPFVTLTVITIDRFMVITSKSIGNRWREPKWIAVAIAATWIYSISMVLLMAFHFTWPGNEAYEWNVAVEWYYPFICIHIAIPLFVITVLYVKIINTAKRSRSQASYHSTPNQSALTRREVRLAKTISILVGLLLVVWLPVLVMEYFYATESESCLVSKLGVVSVWFTCINGMINPIVYSLRNYQLRQGVKRIVLSCFCLASSRDGNRERKSSNQKQAVSDSVQISTVSKPEVTWRKKELYPGYRASQSQSRETLDSAL